MNQDTHRPSTTANEVIDPFVKRVTTVKPGEAVVIFRYQGRFKDQAMCDDITAQFKIKMGEIPFIVIDELFDVTVLKQASGAAGMLIA